MPALSTILPTALTGRAATLSTIPTRYSVDSRSLAVTLTNALSGTVSPTDSRSGSVVSTDSRNLTAPVTDSGTKAGGSTDSRSF